MRQKGPILGLLIALFALAACGTAGSGATSATPPAGSATPATPTVSSATPAASGQGGDTSLAAIKRRGKLIVGVKYDLPLFGLLNPGTGQVEGFDVDMARAVAQQIFGNPEAIEFKEAVTKDRIPFLQQGVVDVVFSTMTANEERAREIDFSDTYYVAGQSLLVPTDSTITGVDTIDDKIVGTVKGSTSEQNIRKAAPKASVELFDTYSEAVQAMQLGRIDVVTTDDNILYGLQKKTPDKLKVVGGQFTQEPYAAGVKKGNTELLDQVNAAIRNLKQSGKWADIYRKWISDAVPQVPPQDWHDVGKRP